jgi:S-layer family protein
MNKKKILRVVSLVVVFCFTLTFAVFAAPKDKLPYGQEKKLTRYNFDYNLSASFMKEKGIIKGYGNGDLGLDDYVKRGDITIMIVRAFNINTIVNRYVENFDDVEYGSYYYDAIVAARSYGIAKGNGKSFNPKKYVTIKEAILLIERSAAVANSNVTVEDVDLEDLYDDGELDEYATRSDIANMIYYVLTGDEYDGSEAEDTNLDTIEYTIKENTILTFDDDKLIDEFEDATNDEEFDYVNFTLPSSSYGRLYYDYTSESNYDSLVKSTTKYYDNANPNISDVTFVPKANYTGTVSIKYTAYDEDGDSHLGVIKIIIQDDDINIDTIKYTIKENTKITFDEDDIVDAFEDATDDEKFDYVNFTLPSTSYGRLYYDYTSETNYDSLVRSTTKYYDNTDPNISNVTFVPKTNYTGTVSIKYTAYDEDGDSYLGIIKVVVEDNEFSLDTINYETDENTSLTFDEEDFVDILENETDRDLNYVKFILPSSHEGKLYYDYSETSNYKSVVAESVKYFVDSAKYISKVTFVPYTNFYGTVNIDYIAYDEDGVSYEGTIRITVNED